MSLPDKEPEPKLVYLLPNLMTAGNLFCGFMAVLKILQGSMERQLGVLGYESAAPEWWVFYEQSLFFILGAFIFDMLDGRVARLGGQESPFGREFDSLADVVSFGVAPALLVFKIVLFEFEGRVGWFIAFLYLACGAMRLARFNTIAASPDSKSALKEFTGFPIPAAAGLIASVTLVLLDVYEGERSIGSWRYALAGLMLFLSWMMFSKFKFPSFKSVDLKTRLSIPRVLIAALVAGFVFLNYRYSLAVLFTGYLLYGFLRPSLSKAWRTLLGDDEDEGDEPAH